MKRLRFDRFARMAGAGGFSLLLAGFAGIAPAQDAAPEPSPPEAAPEQKDAEKPDGPSGRINFSPSTALFDAAEGPDVERPYFQWGERHRIQFFPPRDATVFSSADSYRIGPKKFPGSEVLVKVSPLTPEKLFDKTGMTDYRKAAQALLPGAASGGKVEKITPDPYPINGWKGICLLFGYTSKDVAFLREVAFVNVGEKNQIAVVVAAEEKDFKAVREIAHQFLNTWFVTEGGAEGPVLN